MAKIIIGTPYGIASWPRIVHPDVKGQYADNKYKTDLIVTEEKAKAFLEKLKPYVPKGKKNPLMPVGQKDDGTWFIRAKSKFQPQIEDANGEPWDLTQDIGGGSVIRLGCEVAPWDKGVSLRLKLVKVKTLKQYQANYFADDDEEEDDDVVTIASTDDDDDL